MSDWKNASFLAPKCIDHEVNGVNHRFYAITVGAAIRVRMLGADLAEALTVLFEGHNNDVTQVIREVPDELGLNRETVIEEIKPELAQFRSTQRSGAVSKAIQTVLDPVNAGIVGEILIDSLRETFPFEDKTNPPGIEFMALIPLPALKDMIVGLAKANAGVFGPFEKKAQEMGEVIARRLDAEMSKETPGSE